MASARAVNALAYTVGSNVVFGAGQYAPASSSGRQLLAHELTHVVQQRSGPVDGTPTGGGVNLSDPNDRFEQAAEANAASIVSGQRVEASQPAASTSAPALQRDETDVQALSIQREGEEEEEVQALSIQREGEEEEEMPS